MRLRRHEAGQFLVFLSRKKAKATHFLSRVFQSA